MTHREAVIISAYTGFLFAKDFEDVHRFCEKILGRPIYTHEFADPTLRGKIRAKCEPLVEELVHNLT
ncbi:MAG: hypothetical protein MR295_08445 [Ruminococcus bromii]|nr:hypothetical protein [Ruminococcus bromii]